LGGATIRKTIFTCVYIEKKILFSRTSEPISIKLGTNYPWVKEISKLLKLRAKSFCKGPREVITKMQKWDGVI
jgi:hypothetical protein